MKLVQIETARSIVSRLWLFLFPIVILFSPGCSSVPSGVQVALIGAPAAANGLTLAILENNPKDAPAVAAFASTIAATVNAAIASGQAINIPALVTALDTSAVQNGMDPKNAALIASGLGQLVGDLASAEPTLGSASPDLQTLISSVASSIGAAAAAVTAKPPD